MKRKLFIITYVLFSFLFFACASMYVRGRDPVQRAVSAAELLINGNTSSAYMKVYRKEVWRAETYIHAMLDRAERDNIYYADIADNISDWIALSNRISTLQKIYPDGLSTKNDILIFEFTDYTPLREKAHYNATEALYNKAVLIFNAQYNQKNLKEALNCLKRTKSYSSHLQNEVNNLGAKIAYSIAEELSISNNPENLVEASSYYVIVNSWVQGYNNCLQKAQTVKEKAVSIYIEKGDYNLGLKNYTSFRYAKAEYLNAAKIINGIASERINRIEKLLTVNLLIVFPENNYYYSLYDEENKIRKAINSKLSTLNKGPDTVNVKLIKGDWFIDTRNADLLFLNNNRDGNIVEEKFGQVNSTKKDVSKLIDGIRYDGLVVENSQEVSVIKKNSFTFYDLRHWNRREISTFKNDVAKSSRIFTERHYIGHPYAKPDKFDSGFFYKKGEYKMYFPELDKTTSSDGILTNYGGLNKTGEALVDAIANLQYIEKM